MTPGGKPASTDSCAKRMAVSTVCSAGCREDSTVVAAVVSYNVAVRQQPCWQAHLDHNGVPTGHCRSHLHDPHEQRPIPWDDGPADTLKGDSFGERMLSASRSVVVRRVQEGSSCAGQRMLAGDDGAAACL